MKKRKYLLPLSMLLGCVATFATNQHLSAKGINDSVRFWSADSLLLASDFKYYSDTSIRHSNYCYKTSSLLDIEVYISDYKKTDSEFKYIVYPLFYEYGSWLHDTALLTHAQVHFNISELYARRIRKYLHEATNNPKQLKKIKKGIYDLLEKHAICHEVYDNETNMGKFQNMQIFWNDQTYNKLDTLNNFKSPIDSFTSKQFQ